MRLVHRSAVPCRCPDTGPGAGREIRVLAARAGPACRHRNKKPGHGKPAAGGRYRYRPGGWSRARAAGAPRQFQQGGLAGAIGATQPGDAGTEVPAEALEDAVRGEMKIELLDMQHGSRHIQFHNSLPMALKTRMEKTTSATLPRAVRRGKPAMASRTALATMRYTSGTRR